MISLDKRYGVCFMLCFMITFTMSYLQIKTEKFISQWSLWSAEKPMTNEQKIANYYSKKNIVFFHQLVEQSNILRFDPSIWSYVLIFVFSCPDMKRVNWSKNLKSPMHNFKSFRAVSFQTYMKRSKEKSNWTYRVNMGSLSFFRWVFDIIVKGLKRSTSLTFPWKIDDTIWNQHFIEVVLEIPVNIFIGHCLQKLSHIFINVWECNGRPKFSSESEQSEYVSAH